MAAPPDPAIHQDVHFLARDYAAFRGLMLDDLAANSAETVIQHPANIDVALVEVLAYVADYLSYYQDAVATEAYLETARRRISVRRHARLLDYPLGEGCNARTWVHLQTASDGVVVPAGTALATQIPALDAVRIDHAVATTATMFETMHAVALVKGHNRLRPANPAAVLDPGDDRLDLAGHWPALAVGDVLVLEHADGWAHSVRLTQVMPVGDDRTRIVWHGKDSLPADTPARAGWSLLGNIVLADHGVWLDPEPVDLVPDGRGDVAIDCRNPCFAVPYRHDEAMLDSSVAARQQEPQRAEPAMTIENARARSTMPRGPCWTARRDILRATPFDRVFAVEPIDAARVSLRFGDGVAGRRAPTDRPMALRYRQGCGSGGNIGARTLTHIVSDDDRILAVTNPLAATGGIDPQGIAQAAALAPYPPADRLRCVTSKDFEAAARQLSDVEAVLVRRPAPPAHAAIELHVVRLAGGKVDADFTARLTRAFAPLLLIGEAVRIIPASVLTPEIGIMLPVARSELAAAASAVRNQLIGAVKPGFGVALDIAMIEQAAQGITRGKGARVVAMALGGEADLATIQPRPDQIVRIDLERLTVVTDRQP